MKFYRLSKLIPFFFAFLFVVTLGGYAQNRDHLPAEYREYTNPEEVVTFDRTTSFKRAIDVINQFAQKYRGKVVINRTETSGNIGISVPAMHWMDALKLILRVKQLRLVEKKDFYEIVTKESLEPKAQTQTSGTSGGKQGKGPVANIGTREVRINAIFFEGNKRALREIGVDWSTISENVPDAVIGGGGQGGGGQGGGGQGGQSGASIPDSRFDGPFVQVNSKGAQNVSQDVFNALINVGEVGNTGIRVQSLFSAFEANNLGEILASPTIKVMDGEEGKIQVGQDFSIKQRDIAGNVVENFFSVGTILTVTPQVITQRDTTFIHLDIHAERSSAQPDPVSTIINKQQAETQSLLMDGETTVIAGLYNKETTKVRRGIPILKDLPPWFFGLRYLFGYTSKDISTRELVILVKASLAPTVHERYGDDFKNKYQVLQDERERMQQDLKTSKRILHDKGLKDEQPEQEASQQEEMDPDTAESQQNKADMQKEAAQQDSSEQQTNVNTQEPDDKQKPAISDPEVQPKKVQINLGGSDSTAKSEEQQTMASDTSSRQKASQPMAKSNQTSKANYYLVGGSFDVKQNALDYQDKLQKEGFDALIVRMDESGLTLVAYGAYQNLGKAKSLLNDIQKNHNAEAWLYKTN